MPRIKKKRVSKKRAKLGRPKTGKAPRDDVVAFHVTKRDSMALYRVARDLGFSSRSKLISGIIESLLIGGMSPLSFLQVGFKLNKLAKTHGLNLSKNGKYWANRPMPSLTVEDLTSDEIKVVLEQIEK